MYHELPRDASFWLFLFSVDQDLAEMARLKACPCGGRLHRANYPERGLWASAWGRLDPFALVWRRMSSPVSAARGPVSIRGRLLPFRTGFGRSSFPKSAVHSMDRPFIP